MLPSILKTKLYLPPSRAGIVPRQRLLDRLESRSDCKLTLISAPAGFGKTTLLNEWLSGTRKSFVWISLDDNDNDPARFLTYLVAGLRQQDPGIGAGIITSLTSIIPGPSLPLPEPRLAELINEIDEIPEPFVLILDDYHVIHQPGVHHILEFLINHQPVNLGLVICGRSDPPWPLARLRAQGEVAELRTNDLRFTPAEATAFLNEIMNLGLSSHQVEILEACTEGWIVGLQMAAISMQGRQDINRFIEAFTGSHRFIADFLLEEVLLRQPKDIQEFLLKTSILERFCAALADAMLYPETSIAGLPSGQSMLEKLDHSNLFLIPLDDERHWYRYHHLFRDLLRANLLDSLQDEVPQLHKKASQWFASVSLFEEAVSHAFASQDSTWTANLIELAAQQIDILNKQVVIAGWIERLPPDLVTKRPWLCVFRAWGQYWTGRREQVETSLAEAEKALEEILHQKETDSGNGSVPALSPEAENHIRGHVAAIHAHSALTAENIPRVLEMGERALALLPLGDEFRSETGIALGGAYWALGDVHRSEKAFASARSDALMSNRASLAVPSSCYMAMQLTKQGRVDEAMATYREALRLGTMPDGKETAVAGFANIKLGDLLRERNDLDKARTHLLRGIIQCEQLGQADVLADGYVSLARLQITLGDLNSAGENLNKALAVLGNTKVDPFVIGWLDECRVRLWRREGNLDAALEWVKTSGLTPDGPFSYHYDMHHINLAQVMLFSCQRHLSKPSLDQALDLLDRLLNAARKADWTHESIKCLVLKVLALDLENSPEAALSVLAEALRLAMPGGYARIFIDEGEPMKFLLERVTRSLASEPRLAAYNARLLSGFTTTGSSQTELQDQVNRQVSQPPNRLVEPLSDREKGILKLLNTGLTSGEIASELFLSVHTVRTHIKNIYGKLGASRRIEAIQKAKELKLL